MIKVEMADVIAVLQLCKPYIIVIAAAIVLGIIAVKRAIRCGNGSCDRCLCQHDLFWPDVDIDRAGNGRRTVK